MGCYQQRALLLKANELLGNHNIWSVQLKDLKIWCADVKVKLMLLSNICA